MKRPARLPVPITTMVAAEIVPSVGITEVKPTKNTELSS